ncbi:hypothetical protein [Burkholderia savannae]|uniref:hypothetical protein n=1 Tax=Burkholderia savannae TaxID=1637837 RepID=UPI0012E3BF35|nr:hypothetical protein [Burkholderia savannae]
MQVINDFVFPDLSHSIRSVLEQRADETPSSLRLRARAPRGSRLPPLVTELQPGLRSVRSHNRKHHWRCNFDQFFRDETARTADPKNIESRSKDAGRIKFTIHHLMIFLYLE